MGLQFKKLLVNILVLMVVMLPFRDAFAMPLNISSKHCMAESINVIMPMMNHEGHNMPVSVSASDSMDTDQGQNKSNCGCCSQCDNSCTSCTHISAITLNFFHLPESNSTEVILIVSDSSLTRTVSPPSRPPLAL